MSSFARYGNINELQKRETRASGSHGPQHGLGRSYFVFHFTGDSIVRRMLVERQSGFYRAKSRVAKEWRTTRAAPRARRAEHKRQKLASTTVGVPASRDVSSAHCEKGVKPLLIGMARRVEPEPLHQSSRGTCRNSGGVGVDGRGDRQTARPFKKATHRFQIPRGGRAGNRWWRRARRCECRSHPARTIRRCRPRRQITRLNPIFPTHLNGMQNFVFKSTAHGAQRVG
jgi:hypothetical protein